MRRTNRKPSIKPAQRPKRRIPPQRPAPRRAAPRKPVQNPIVVKTSIQETCLLTKNDNDNETEVLPVDPTSIDQNFLLQSKPEVQPESELEAPPESQSEPEVQPKSEPEVQPESKPEAQPESESEKITLENINEIKVLPVDRSRVDVNKPIEPKSTVQKNIDKAYSVTNNPYALLVGIEYTRYAQQKKIDRLPGCHKDVQIMKKLLETKFGVPTKNIKILMDHGKGQTPNLRNIRQGLSWLKKTNSKNLWFCYSGHGSNVRDRSGDELDGRDEVLVPDDFLSSGYLQDDELRKFAASLPKDTKFTSVFDCCHSGTMMDLPHYYHSAKPHIQGKGSKVSWPANGATIVSLSACADHQTSVSAYNLDRQKNWGGALTFAFNQVAREGYADGLDLLLKVSRMIQSRGFGQITFISTSHSYSSPKDIQFPA